MANTIRIKRRSSGNPGAPAILANSELAMNEVDSTLYIGIGTGGVDGSATSALAIGGPGAFVSLTGDQTISGTKTVTGSFSFTTGNLYASTALSGDDSTRVATTAFVKAQSYLTGNQSISLSGDATGSGTTSIAVTLKNTGTAGTYTKVTTDAQGRVTSGTTLGASDIPTLTASKISDFDTQVRTSRLDQLAIPTASVSLNNQKITNLADPVNALDAVNKQYCDSVAQGLDAKASVKAATTANITLSGTQTIDGIALIAGDRVLVKNQSDPSKNGIWVVAAGAWARATDLASWTAVPNAFTFVEQGTTQADTGWVSISEQGGTLESTAIAWTQFSGAGSYVAGNGLNLSGTTFSAVGTTNRISVGAGGIDISGSYVGQTSITTLGTISTGTWSADTIAVTRGGTGATSLSGLLKGNGTSAFTAAVDGTDYLSPSATIDGGSF